MVGAVSLLILGPVALVVGAAQLAGWKPMPLTSRRERLVFGSMFAGVGLVSLVVGLLQALFGWWIG